MFTLAAFTPRVSLWVTKYAREE